ncbi:MAG: creatininase family protein [Halobacteriales archaeon]|nr:creatininase family protein [Halobacteriales archaeon]
MEFASEPWTRVAELAAQRAIVLLPLGAIEAHGPHLPLETDSLLALALARRCAERLRAQGKVALVAPAIATTAASFAADFPGTVSIDAESERRIVVNTVQALHRLGAARVALVNLHFDPEHMRAVKGAMAELDAARTVFPDVTRRVHAQRIGGEFATGACHAGEFETSILLAVAPERVDGSHRDLPPREVDLAAAIREGKRSFRELGLDQAYCGHPATATAEEGERLLGVLADIVLEALA